MANSQAVRQESKFMVVDEVAEILHVSQSTAYRIIRNLNNELKKEGKITVAGKISRRYFEEKCYM